MYIHLDCNNFFVSCELVSRPELRGTPVVVANDNGNNGGIIFAQYNADETLKLTTATDDSTQIIHATKLLLDKLFRENYQYKQAGVILGQLQGADGVQLDLFAPNQAEENARKKRLMQAIDVINKRFGQNQIHFAVQGTEAIDDQPAGFMRPHDASHE